MTGPGHGGAGSDEPLVRVRDLSVRFPSPAGGVHAVNRVSFDLASGESLALVGESGSGKSVTALALLGLVPRPGRVEGGSIRLEGRELVGLGEREMRRVRGGRIAMIFQDPTTSLNPVLTVGRQIVEVVELHRGRSGPDARREAAGLLERVGIPDPERRLRSFPHEFSGGQRQRIMIAMALAARPALLVADEPTTALDVTIQAQIVGLVQELQSEFEMAVLWITHDLALVAGLAHRVAVMYAGRIVEEAPAAELFGNPRHPYTRGLLGALPRLEGAGTRGGAGGHAPHPHAQLTTIPGRPPVLRAPPDHCPFAPRCAWVQDRCRAELPPFFVVPSAADAQRAGERAPAPHRSACFRWEEL